MTYYDFVKEYMNVDECKNNKKYSSAGHTFCWSKDDSINEKVYIGFMKEMDLLLISTIFISKKKLFKIVLIVWKTMFRYALAIL